MRDSPDVGTPRAAPGGQRTTGLVTPGHHYDAFISYHSASSKPAAAYLQRELERVARHSAGDSGVRIFRDATHLTYADLGVTLEAQLRRARRLILVLHRSTRQSPWVDREVSYWLAQGGDLNRLILARADPNLDLSWDRAASRFLHEDELPASLGGLYTSEPLWIDLSGRRFGRPVADEGEVARLCATLLERDPTEVLQREVREQQSRRRRLRAVLATVMVLLLVAVLATVVAVDQRDRAEREARIAMARLLGNESSTVGPTGVDVGLLLAAHAYAAEPDAPSSWGALAGALTRSPALVGYLPDSAAATTVTAAPRGNLLAVGDEDGAVTLWRGARRERLQALSPPLPGTVTALAFNEVGNLLIAGDDSGHYAVWDIGSGRSIDAGTVASAVRAVGLDPAGTRFAVGTEEEVSYASVGQALRPLMGGGFTQSLVFGTDILTAASGQGRMVSWRMPAGDRVADEYVGLGQPLASAFSRDLKLFAGVTLGNEPYIIDVESGEDVLVDAGQTGLSIDEVAFDPGGTTLVIVTGAGLVLWDVANNRQKAPILTGIPGAYHDVSMAEGGAVIAAVGERGVAVWSPDARSPLMQRVEPRGSTSPDAVPNVLRGALSAAFSPDGSLLAWTAHDGAQLFVVLWDLNRGRERTRIPGEEVLSFSPDGEQIATRTFGSEDLVEVTDLGSGHTERSLAVPWDDTGPHASAEGTGSSPQGWQVSNGLGLGASIPADGTVALWDTDRAQQIGQFDIGVQPDAAALTFDARGKRLAVTVSGGLAFVVDVDPESWRRLACSLVAREFTGAERVTYLGSVQLPDGCP